jgi:trk system potassium uptake protein TrkA
MKVVIVGCGRVGALVAENLDIAGHDVLVLDIDSRAFDRLPTTFGGRTVRGDGTDEDVLRKAEATDADLFLALTEGDNRNVITTQLAAESLGARRVVAKVNDPLRAAAYADLGIATLCRTNLMADSIHAYLGMPRRYEAGVQVPRGHHPGGEHHDTPGQLRDAVAASSSEEG